MTASREVVLTVGQVTSLIKDSLEQAFPDVWVSGEIGDLSQSHAGHIYFSLKDSQALVRAVIWGGTASRLKFKPQDGQAVLCRGSIDVYPPRGSYQLIVRQIEPKGEGALQVALRQLHAKLAAEGLFDERHKQPLPRFPRRVAVVTSPTSAAVRDFLEVVRRRWPALEVLVIPARVQGDGASAEVARGIQYANAISPRPDILVVTRGGGSLEDLWAFNEEPVVRAIFASEIPVVSAIGHEIDVTLADLVADVRALTPTEAGERVAPSRDELRSAVRQLGTRLVGGLRRRAAEARLRLDNLSQRRCLRRPFDRIQELKRRVDELDMRAVAAARRAIRRSHDRILSMAAQLESLSPLAVLTRGYSVTVRAEDRRLLVDAADVRAGELIETRLRTGAIVSRVEKADT